MGFEQSMAFATLFAGGTSAWFDSDRTSCRRSPVSFGHFDAHLLGRLQIGIYPVTRHGLCRWGCLDFDRGDTLGQARAVLEVADRANVKGWIESSRSKGHHVWFFFRQWLPAKVVRQCLQAIDAEAGTDCPEINPKSIDPRIVGNCVRLPYSPKASPGRMVAFEGDQELGLAQFCDKAMALRIGAAAAVNLAALAPVEHPPERSLVERLRSKGLIQGAPPTQGTIHLVYEGSLGVGEGERDNTFWVLANYCQALGLSLDEAIEKVVDVWEEQTEQQGYSLNQAIEKVERVYR